MFKEEYKKHYDEIHPSPELIERTKKLALEQYQSKTLKQQEKDFKEQNVEEESYEAEEIQYSEEEKIIFLGLRKKKILQIAVGIAAGVTLVSVGYLFSGTLRQQKDSIGTVLENTIEPTSPSIPSNTPSKTEHSTKKKKKKPGEKKENNHSKEQKETTKTTALTSLAKMGNGDGVRLDYAANDLVIFHGNFGILGYNLSSRELVVKIPAKKYQFPDMWTFETVIVNREGTKIAWSGAASSSMEMDVYDIAAKTYYKIDSIEWQKEYQDFSEMVSVLETDADVYSSKATDMCVKFSDSRVCQLIYQAPSLSLQASLGIAIVDMAAGTEEIYDVFGSEGREIVKSYGLTYEGYHNEYGKKIFESQSAQTESPEETPEPTTEPTESVPVTEVPVEATPTLIPDPTENVIRPEVTESSQRLTQSIENTE